MMGDQFYIYAGNPRTTFTNEQKLIDYNEPSSGSVLHSFGCLCLQSILEIKHACVCLDHPWKKRHIDILGRYYSIQ